MMNPQWHRLPASHSAPVNMKMTLCGGQCFRWFVTPRNTFVGVVQHRAYELRECVVSSAVSETKADRDLSRAVSGDAGAVRYIEFRRLSVPSPGQLTRCVRTAQSQRRRLSSSPRACYVNADGGRRKHIPVRLATSVPCTHNNAESSDEDVAEDESFLSWFLALDVNVAALWRQWTTQNASRDHPLVRYLVAQLVTPSSTLTTSCNTHGRCRSVSSCRQMTDREREEKTELPACACVPVRHLRQDLHETLFSFLCSQNNHVKRITAMIDTLCKSYGDYLCSIHRHSGAVRYSPIVSLHKRDSTDAARKTRRDCDVCRSRGLSPLDGGLDSADIRVDEAWADLYSFPTVDQLSRASEEELRGMGFGYRSRYIVNCARVIAAHVPSNTPSCVIPTHTANPSSHPEESSIGTDHHLVRGMGAERTRQHATSLGLPFYEQLLWDELTVRVPASPMGDKVVTPSASSLQRENEKLTQHCEGTAALVQRCGARRSVLMSLPGVGRKVADCVLLFALGHSELVPVDTHMAQIAATYLSVGAPVRAGVSHRSRCHALNELAVNTMGCSDRVSTMREGAPQEGHTRKAAHLSSTPEADRHDESTHDAHKIHNWQSTLAAWAARARVSDVGQQPRATAVKTVNATASYKRTRTAASPLPTPPASDVSSAAALSLPTTQLAPLSDRVHDAIQDGFRALFGSSCGLAHSVLFYDRMRKA